MCIICQPARRAELERATYLDCHGCPNVTVIPLLPKLRHLDCSNCPLLATIPVLPRLKYLTCVGCPNLTVLPVLPRLRTLNCRLCPLLAALPALPGLGSLNCSSCPSLATLPVLPRLTHLYASDCPRLTALSELPKLAYLQCDPWIDHPLNPRFAAARGLARAAERFRVAQLRHRRFNLFRSKPEYSAYLSSPGHIGYRLAMAQFRALEGAVEMAAVAAAAAQPAAAAAADPEAIAELERRVGARWRMEQDHTEQGKEKQQKRE